MAITQWGNSKFDEAAGGILIYSANGTLWGEAVYSEAEGRTEIYQYQGTTKTLVGWIKAQDSGETDINAEENLFGLGNPIGINDQATGELTVLSTPDPNYLPSIYYKDDWNIIRPVSGQSITITMVAVGFTDWMVVFDATDLENPIVGYSSPLVFVPQAGKDYVIRVSTNNTEEVGTYTLTLVSP